MEGASFVEPSLPPSDFDGVALSRRRRLSEKTPSAASSHLPESPVASSRRRLLRKTSSAGVATSLHGDSPVLRRRISDVPGADSQRLTSEMGVQPSVSASGCFSELSLEEQLAAVMEEEIIQEEFTPEPACEHVSSQEIWRRFTPTNIDPTRCQARTFNKGSGGQCQKKPRGGQDICGGCKNLAHGRVDGPIPEAKLKAFLRHAEKA